MLLDALQSSTTMNLTPRAHQQSDRTKHSMDRAGNWKIEKAEHTERNQKCETRFRKFSHLFILEAHHFRSQTCLLPLVHLVARVSKSLHLVQIRTKTDACAHNHAHKIRHGVMAQVRTEYQASVFEPVMFRFKGQVFKNHIVVRFMTIDIFPLNSQRNVRHTRKAKTDRNSDIWTVD